MCPESDILDYLLYEQPYQIFIHVLPNETYLDLSAKALFKKDAATVAQAFATIPLHVTHLDIAQNRLYLGTPEWLIQFFSVIPPQVIHLDLSFNTLGTKTVAELVQAFSALHPKIKSLDISNNDLKDEQVLEIWSALLLQQVKQYIDKKDFNFIVPNIKIDNNLEDILKLEKIIANLEQKNTSLAYFTCGLLLSGIIEIPVDLSEKTHQARLEFIEHCEHSAIYFYNHAYQLGDAQLKEFSSHYLWHLRATAQFESVRERLNSYDLQPSPSYMEGYNQSPWRKHATQLPTSWLRKGFFIQSASLDEGSSSNAVPTIGYRSRA